MSRIFAYCRVSVDDLTTQNQVEAVKRAGYEVKPSRVIEEVISGATPAMDRPQFVKLVDKLEEGDCLVVTKIDRLGRDNIDVQKTVTMGTVAKLAMRQPFVLFKGLTFQKLC
ncbi:recombinase family protein, partial [Escherichia coli]|nr:recombinase family protein [Escherichia coli]